MVRKLCKSLLSLSLIAPVGAYALGLGDVHLHSALSERLQADIELLSVSSAEAKNLNVSLASQETFAKVGLERPAILMYLKFDVVQDAAGNHLIKVSSVEPINEPFLDFLVEVDWKSGRVLREYTLLLDPPSGQQEAAPAVSAPAATIPAVTTPTRAATTPTAEPAAEAAGSEAAAMQPTATAEKGTTVSAAPMAPAAKPMQGAAPMPAGALVYGPVKANDTLWRIAEKLRPSQDVSVQQMMLALLKANPYAFFDNNINRLKRGYVLRIDDPSMIGAMGKADANREVARQTRAWQDYRESVAARAQQRPAKAAAVEPTPGAAAAVKKEPKLKLVAPEGKAVDSAAPSGTVEGKAAGDVSEELMLALESSAAQRKENETLKTRLEALEGQLQDMEKIISLKDADLAALQQQLREQGKAVELATEQKPAAEAAVEPGLVVKAEEKPVEEPKPQETPVAAEADKPAVMTGEEAVKPEAVKPTEVKPEATKKPEVKKPKPVRRPVAPPPPPPEPTLIDMLMDNLMYVIGGVVALLLLILLAIFAKRRRKGGFQESILNTGGSSSMMKASDEQGSETSFLSDLAISGMGPGTIQTDEGEADPITEAEVFMAYGRNQQAEEVLKKAREHSPERVDIAAKLLEVYYNSKDSEKFEALAEEAVGALQADDALWGKVLAMGNELCPENVLFEGGAGAPAAAPAAAEPAGGDVMDIGLDLDELTAEMEGEGGGGDLDLDLGLDFSDLEDEGTGEVGELDLGEPEAAVEESSELEMDLGALETGAESEDAGLDFDFDMGGAEEAVEESGMEFDLDLGAGEEVSAESTDSGMDFDLGDLAVGEEESAAEELSFDLDMGELTTEGDEEAADMSLDMDLGSLGDITSEESVDLDMSLDDFGGLDDLGDLDTGEDEMTTKLDLAQAYAEMGDAEGARSMLEEVVAGGNDEQKQQAQALIDKL